MEKILTQKLAPGESVVWSGRPAPFKLLGAECKSKILLRWAACLAALLGLTIPVLMNLSKLNPVALVMTIGIPVVVAIQPVLLWNGLNRRTVYGVTSERLIVAYSNSFFHSLPLSDVKQVRAEALPDGGYAVFVNNACDRPLGKARNLTAYAQRDEGAVKGLAFYSVDSAFVSLISKYGKAEAA